MPDAIERQAIAHSEAVAFEFQAQVPCSISNTTIGHNDIEERRSQIRWGNLLGTSGWTLDVPLETSPPRWSDYGAQKENKGPAVLAGP